MWIYRSSNSASRTCLKKLQNSTQAHCEDWTPIKCQIPFLVLGLVFSTHGHSFKLHSSWKMSTHRCTVRILGSLVHSFNGSQLHFRLRASYKHAFIFHISGFFANPKLSISAAIEVNGWTTVAVTKTIGVALSQASHFSAWSLNGPVLLHTSVFTPCILLSQVHLYLAQTRSKKPRLLAGIEFGTFRQWVLAFW